jgi:hypothetical protein
MCANGAKSCNISPITHYCDSFMHYKKFFTIVLTLEMETGRDLHIHEIQTRHMAGSA